MLAALYHAQPVPTSTQCRTLVRQMQQGPWLGGLSPHPAPRQAPLLLSSTSSQWAWQATRCAPAGSWCYCCCCCADCARLCICCAMLQLFHAVCLLQRLTPVTTVKQQAPHIPHGNPGCHAGTTTSPSYLLFCCVMTLALTLMLPCKSRICAPPLQVA
jgi:hypothetical protein